MFKNMEAALSRAIKQAQNQRVGAASNMPTMNRPASQTTNIPRLSGSPPAFSSMAANAPKMVSQVMKSASGKMFKSGGKSKKLKNW